MLHVQALDHIVLEVRDVEASLDFYCNVLGFTDERTDDFRAEQAPFPSVRVGASLIDLFPAVGTVSRLNHFCIEVSDGKEALIEELKTRGIQFEKPLMRFGAKGNGFSVYIRDPDDHVVELRTYEDC